MAAGGDLDEKDLRIDVFRKVGPDADTSPISAVRMTHLPTGKTVFVDDFPTASENRDEALRRLRRKLEAH